MPRLLDPLERRAEICEAVWRLIADGGVRAASFRAVAAETGLAVASVRHYAASQELLVFRAMAELLRRQRGWGGADVRELRAFALRDPLGFACSSVESLLPFRKEELTQARAWAAFALEAGSFADELRRERDEDLHGACLGILRGMARSGLVHESRDAAGEAQRLWRLAEGMIWRAAVCSTVARGDRALVRLHLGDLAGPDLLATETLEPSQD